MMTNTETQRLIAEEQRPPSVNNLVEWVAEGQLSRLEAALSAHPQCLDWIIGWSPRAAGGRWLSEPLLRAYWRLVEITADRRRVRQEEREAARSRSAAHCTSPRPICPTGTTEGTRTEKPCEVCGAPADWNPGAGQALCPDHWDDY